MTTAENNSGESRSKLRAKETKRITLWGVFINLFLAIIKVTGGIIGQSQALLADGGATDALSGFSKKLAEKISKMSPALRNRTSSSAS